MMTAIPNHGEHATLPISQLKMAAQIRTRNGLDDDSIKELAATIQTHGLMQPIVVRATGPDEYTIVAGHRRYLACQRLKLQAVPVTVRESQDDATTRAAQAVENLQRVDLNLMDKAEGVAALVRDVGAKRTAGLIGKSPSWISKHVALTKMHASIRELVTNGTTQDLEVVHGLKLIRAKDQALFEKLAEELTLDLADRATVRKHVEKLRAAAVEQAGDDDDDAAGDGDDSDADSGSNKEPREKLGKLELHEGPAKLLLAAVVYANKSKPSSRPGEALEHCVRDFIKQTWGE